MFVPFRHVELLKNCRSTMRKHTNLEFLCCHMEKLILIASVKVTSFLES